MPKKRKSYRIVTQQFIDSHSTAPSRNGLSSFSQAVVKDNVESQDYKNCWPQLNSEPHCSFNFSVTSQGSVETPLVNNAESFSTVNIPTETISVPPSRLEKIEEQSSSLIDSDNTLDVLEINQFPTLYDSFQNIKAREKGHIPSFDVSQPTEVNNSLVTLKTLKKQPKRNDPLTIELISAIQLGALKKIKEPKYLKNFKKKQNREVQRGNILDSSKPIYKKGKVRPNRKKKLSTLKKLILEVRSLKNSNPPDVTLTEVSVVDQDLFLEEAKAMLHFNKFQKYCTNMVSKELVAAVIQFLSQLRKFQDRMYFKDKIKAWARRRYACGFHECKKLLKAGSLKLIIMAANIENNKALFDVIKEISLEAEKQGIPVVYAGTCQELSRCLFKKNRICIVGIINYEGANELYKMMISILEKDKLEYNEKLNQLISPRLEESNENESESMESCLATNLLEKLKEGSFLGDNEQTSDKEDFLTEKINSQLVISTS